LHKLNIVNIVFNPSDNGGRRVGIERRQFSYSNHIPERRFLENRRIAGDRRMNSDRRSGFDRRQSRMQTIVTDLRNHRDRRDLACRRSGADRRDFIIV
jgi:hypothetical protein